MPLSHPPAMKTVPVVESDRERVETDPLVQLDVYPANDALGESHLDRGQLGGQKDGNPLEVR